MHRRAYKTRPITHVGPVISTPCQRTPPFGATNTGIPTTIPALSRVDTHSSIASDATAPNLTGAGRTLGLLIYALGARFEAFLNKRAARLHLGPEGVAQEIRRLRRHEDVSFAERLASPAESITTKEKKELKRLCGKLVMYSRSVIPCN